MNGKMNLSRDDHTLALFTVCTSQMCTNILSGYSHIDTCQQVRPELPDLKLLLSRAFKLGFKVCELLLAGNHIVVYV